jgi:hypothetical protein
LGIGDWGLGIGDWGLGPIPNPQSPIPNPHIGLSYFKNKSKKLNIYKNLYYFGLKSFFIFFFSNRININFVL